MKELSETSNKVESIIKIHIQHKLKSPVLPTNDGYCTVLEVGVLYGAVVLEVLPDLGIQ